MYLIVFMGVMLLLPLQACALSGGPLQGKVMEEGTEKPIAGAIVVARWQGHLASWGHGKTVCYHVLSTTSDENGDYRLPAWKKDITEDWQKNIRPETVLIDAYKPGYGLPTAPSQKRGVVSLKSFIGTPGERIEYLLRVSSATRCGTTDESEKNLLPLKKTLYREATAIASSKEDQEKVETLLFGLESLEFGSVEALNRMTERRKVKK